MKITTSTTTLTITNSATGGRIAGIVLMTLGAGLGLGGVVTGQNGPTWLFSGAGFFVVGLVSLFFTKGEQIVIDKQSGITVTQKRLVGNARTETAPIDKVAAVLLTITFDTRSSTQDSTSGSFRTPTITRRSTVALALQDGGRIELGTALAGGGVTINGMPMGGMNKVPLQSEAQQVADFLGLQLTVQDMTSVGNVIPTPQPQQPTSFNPNPVSIPPAAAAQPVQPQQTPQVPPPTVPPVSPAQ